MLKQSEWDNLIAISNDPDCKITKDEKTGELVATILIEKRIDPLQFAVIISQFEKQINEAPAKLETMTALRDSLYPAKKPKEIIK